MKIGIDFDNTIACYDQVFARIAIKQGLLAKAFQGNKESVKSALLGSRDDGESDWMRLQGQVYGAFMTEAHPFAGFMAFVERASKAEATLLIISHKTEFGHFDTAKINLRDAARTWLMNLNIIGDSDHQISRDNVYFENSREDKLARITKCQCSHFIDDLPEVLGHPDFPQKTRALHFGVNHTTVQTAKACENWQAVSEAVFDN